MRRSNLKSRSIRPVPITTEANGSSAIETGRPVSSRIRKSKVAKQRATPRQHDPAVADIGAQLGGSPFECNSYRIHDGVDAFCKRLSDLGVVNLDRPLAPPSIRLRPLISIVKGVSNL